jgi:hypothetical protein
MLLSVALLFTQCKTTQSVVETSPVDIKQYQGGMWVPSELAGKNEMEMKALGSTLSAKDIYDTEAPSLKDAIVHFGGGCTAEIISPKGLILTNHHCGYGEIQSHSSLENDYLANGFWASSFSEELPNEGLTAAIVQSVENVTEAVFAGTTGLDNQAMKAKMEANIAQLKKDNPVADYQTIEVKAYSHGNAYYLIISDVYEDVRLVGAPPSSIGKFGADTDNWMWPRHSGDFSLFRIYAGTDNKPAKYSENNVPYTPKHYLPVSAQGVEEGDFTMVFGFPGRTNEYLPSVAVEQIVNDLNPDKIALREASLAVMDKYMRQDPQIKIQYASKFAGIANYWKKWIGESQGLEKSQAVAKKQMLEADFQRIVNEKGLDEYKELLPRFNKLYAEYGPKAKARDYFVETLRNVDLMYLGYQLFNLEQVEKQQGKEAFLEAKDAFIKRIKSFYKDYNPQVDKDVFSAVVLNFDNKFHAMKMNEQARQDYWNGKIKDIYGLSKLTTYEGLKNLLDGDKSVLKALNEDPGYAFAKGRIVEFMSDLNPKYYEVKDKIDALQKTYTKGLMEVFPNMRYFPDANSTLRVTYGQVKGYEPVDGMVYLPVTHLEGVMEKYVPGDYEFDVSDRLIDLYNTKDYGSYADASGRLPVNFLGTNHTTGGNSGSPVLDAKGNLIGLNFDRVWEGTMSDYNYDADICRNIMVDTRYILWVIDKYAGAHRLIEEMTIVK